MEPRARAGNDVSEMLESRSVAKSSTLWRPQDQSLPASVSWVWWRVVYLVFRSLPPSRKTDPQSKCCSPWRKLSALIFHSVGGGRKLPLFLHLLTVIESGAPAPRATLNLWVRKDLRGLQPHLSNPTEQLHEWPGTWSELARTAGRETNLWATSVHCHPIPGGL